MHISCCDRLIAGCLTDEGQVCLCRTDSGMNRKPADWYAAAFSRLVGVTITPGPPLVVPVPGGGGRVRGRREGRAGGPAWVRGPGMTEIGRAAGGWGVLMSAGH